MRSGHRDYEWCHLKFNHGDKTTCSCKWPKTPEHIVYCRKTTRLRGKWPIFKHMPKTPYDYWLRLIARPKNFAYFFQIARFFEVICPHEPNKAPEDE